MGPTRKRRRENPEHQPPERRPSRHRRPEDLSSTHRPTENNPGPSAVRNIGAWIGPSLATPIGSPPPQLDELDDIDDEFFERLNDDDWSSIVLNLPPDLVNAASELLRQRLPNDAVQTNVLPEQTVHSFQQPSLLPPAARSVNLQHLSSEPGYSQQSFVPPSSARALVSQFPTQVSHTSNPVGACPSVVYPVAAQNRPWTYQSACGGCVPPSATSSFTSQRHGGTSHLPYQSGAPSSSAHLVGAQSPTWATSLPNHRGPSPLSTYPITSHPSLGLLHPSNHPNASSSMARPITPSYWPSHVSDHLDASPPTVLSPRGAFRSPINVDPSAPVATPIAMQPRYGMPASSYRADHTLGPDPQFSAPSLPSPLDSFVYVGSDAASKDPDWRSIGSQQEQSENIEHNSGPLHPPPQSAGLPMTPTSHHHRHQHDDIHQHAYPTPSRTRPRPTRRQLNQASAQQPLYSPTDRLVKEAGMAGSDPTRHLMTAQFSGNPIPHQSPNAPGPSQASPQPPSQRGHGVFCPQCLKNFPGRAELNKHADSHRPQAERPHKCETCGMNFNEEKDLVRHFRTASHRDRVSRADATSFREATDSTVSVEQRWFCSVQGCAGGTGRGVSRKDNCWRHIRQWHPKLQRAKPVMREM